MQLPKLPRGFLPKKICIASPEMCSRMVSEFDGQGDAVSIAARKDGLKGKDSAVEDMGQAAGAVFSDRPNVTGHHTAAGATVAPDLCPGGVREDIVEEDPVPLGPRLRL